MEQEEKVITYKGFDKNLCCRGFQYEVGKEYEEKEEIKVCAKGFHACENPLDVLDFYGDIHNSRFCKVEQSGVIQKKDKKQASSKIKVIEEIDFAGLFDAGMDWIDKITNPATIIEESEGTNGENKIASGEDDAKISSSGDYAKIASSGNVTKINSNGYSAQIASSGNYVQISSGDNYARIASSGDDAKIGSSRDCVKIGSSGYNAKIRSKGYNAKIGSSGDDVQISSSGHHAKISSSGDDAVVDSTGENSIICCAGINSIVKAKKGSWITLSEWEFSKEMLRYVPVCVKTEFVDGERIKEDTWYKLQDGEFKEVYTK